MTSVLNNKICDFNYFNPSPLFTVKETTLPSLNVSWTDITPPVFQNCPQIDIMDTLTVTETSKRIEWQTIVAVDNSNGMTFITGTHQSGQFFFEGTTEVTLTARDELNNMATCQFRVVLTRDSKS